MHQWGAAGPHGPQLQAALRSRGAAGTAGEATWIEWRAAGGPQGGSTEAMDETSRSGKQCQPALFVVRCCCVL